MCAIKVIEKSTDSVEPWRVVEEREIMEAIDRSIDRSLLRDHDRTRTAQGTLLCRLYR